MNNLFIVTKEKYPSFVNNQNNAGVIDIELSNSFVFYPWENIFYIQFRTPAKNSDPNYLGKFTDKEDAQRAFNDLRNFISNKNQPKNNHMKQILEDVKGFVKEHRSVIYTVVFVLLVDHFFLDGKLVSRAKGILEKMLSGAEKKIDKITSSENAT
jgi:hypothetical protein